MAVKRGKDEQVLMFALKVVGPVALYFIIAGTVDFSHIISWAESGSSDPLSALFSALIRSAPWN